MENRLPEPSFDDLYQAAILQSPDWLWIFDSSGIPVGVTPKPNAGTLLYEWVHENDLLPLQEACRQLLEQRQPFVKVFRAIFPDDTFIWLEAKGYPVTVQDSHNLHAAIVARDITGLKQHEERLIRLAYYDALTGLANRRLFQDHFYQSLHLAKRYHSNLAILYLDMDNFKRVNDTYGHSIGDELLIMVASRLAHSIRDPDTVCRISGDEFVVLLQQFEHQEDVAKVGRRILDALSQPFNLNGLSIAISCSIGASFYPQDGLNLETLLQCADAAMYTSKQQGKNHFLFYKNMKEASS